MVLCILGLPYSKYTKASDKKVLEEAFVTACSELQHLTAFQSALCDPFAKEVVLNQGPVPNVVNRVAMMAHLLVHEKATPLWEKLHETPAAGDRPAMLDQTDGLAGNKQDIAERLLSLVEVIKEDLDLSRLQPDHCGAEAADAMKDINAAQAVFKNALEILELYTSYTNLHDTLLQRLDSSGNFEFAFERRVKCFANFIGPSGKSKNMGLYYCFLLWEGHPTKFTSHRLGDGISRSSSSSSSFPNDSQGAGSQPPFSQASSFSLSKKDQRQVALIHSIMHPSGRASPPFGSPPFMQDTLSQGSSDSMSPEEIASRKRFLETKTNESEEIISASKCSKLAGMMNDPQFAFLSLDEQREIRKRWFDESRK